MASSNFVVVYDACVLYPAPLRDFLMRLALGTGLFRPCWTMMIHSEWVRNLHASDPSKYTLEKLNKVVDLMNGAIEDSLITDFEDLISGLSLPDPDDRHVLAAAIKANAQVIVTENIKDFPNSYLEKFNVQAKRSDEFVLDLWSLDENAVFDVLVKQQKTLRKPPQSLDEVMATLEINGLIRSVSLFRNHAKIMQTQGHLL